MNIRTLLTPKKSLADYKLLYLLLLTLVALGSFSVYKYFVLQDLNFVIDQCVSVVSETNFSYLDVVFFSHISVAAISLSLGLFVLFKRRSLESVVLFSITLSIALWLALDQLTWSFGYNAAITLTAWSLLSFLTATFFVLNIYFFYVYLYKSDVSTKLKSIFLLLLLPAVVLTPTHYNLRGWDLEQCQAFESPYLTYYCYAIGLVAAVWIALLSIRHSRLISQKNEKRALILLTIGSELAVLIFDLSNVIGSWTLNWKISQYGLFGIPVFIGLLGYLIIKYKAFDVKLIAAQALVIILMIVGSTQIIFVRDGSNTSLKALIFGLFAIFGVWLLFSIKTETRRQEQLSQTNQQLKRLDQAKDDFINIASHQLKSPIAILRSTLENNNHEGSETESKKQISRLETLVSEILLASKLSTEKYSAKKLEDIDLKKLIQEIVDDQISVSKDSIDLTFHFSEGSFWEFSGEPLYLREAFANIIHNAVKYSKQDAKAQIEVALTHNSDQHKYIFTCKDNGIGIDKEDLSKLFSKFSRGSNTYAKSGTGLGLYITKEIIEGHGGHVSVESELGKGTKVTIALPGQQD